jgi:YVTN family beta-propeller protein
MHAPQDRHTGAGQRGRIPARWRAAAVATAAALALAAGAVPASAADGYTVTATIPVGAYPEGVAADPVAGTVYVTNTGDNTVSVIDAATSTVTATIPVGTNPEGVAADPAAGTVYVTTVNAGGAAVSVIDAATNAVTATIPIGSDSFGVAVDPAAGTVYATSSLDGTVSVIDAATNAVTATIPVGSDPAAVAVDPAAGTVYVTNQGDNTVSVIDAATSTVTATIPVGAGPEGVAADPATHTAYVTSGGGEDGAGTVSVISAARVPTALTASIGLSWPRAITLTATLTASGRPLRGQPVSFSTGPTRLCTRDTSTRGVATCVLSGPQARQAGRDHGTIRAGYPGNATYQPSSATAAPPRWWPGS